MDIFDKTFLKQEKRIKKYYDTLLLTELIYLNYSYSNKECHGTTIENIYNNLHKVKYSKKDIVDIINNALYLVKLKYNFDANSFK